MARSAGSTAVRRGDVQGLRAVAVAGVVANHTVHAPVGGFVGVDVFFVISGFLITGLLVREHGRTGRISFVEFYRRRIRRIVPAAFAALTVTVAATFLLYGRGRGTTVVQDALAAAGFVANWRFAAVGTDYFQADGPTSPLQHFWSLSVEEQFYLVWPLLLVVVLAVHRRAGMRRRGRVGAAVLPLLTVVGLGGASLAWAFIETSTSPTVAYFSTPARAWELGIGAVLALAAPRLSGIPHAVRVASAWTGLLIIVGSMIVIDGAQRFPAPLALLPTLGAALVILAGCTDDRWRFGVLDNRLMRWGGDISYSLYLWHFPVVILGGPLVVFLLGDRTSSAVLAPVILVVTALGLAVLSWRCIERPVLRSAWLQPSSSAGLRAYRRGARRPLLALGISVAVCAATVGVAWGTDGIRASVSTGNAEAAPVSTPSPSASGGSGSGEGSQGALTAAITQALAARSWPAGLEPAVADVKNETLPGNTARCGSAAWLPAAECTFGSPTAEHRAVLVGDSIAQSYVPALAAIFGTGSWSLRITSMYACPFIDHAVGVDTRADAVCADRRDQEAQAVATMKPDLLIVGNTFWRGTDPATGRVVTLTDWHAGFEAMMRRVVPDAKQTIVIAPPPYDKDIGACYSAFGGPSACVSSVLAPDSTWSEMLSDQLAAASDLHYTLIDSRPWFCTSGGQCPAFVGKLLTKKDAAHPTALYVERLTPVIRAAFVAAKVPGLEPGGTSG
ncbi:acyltransferase family protein [Curtobacterium ammoniigenes]|uniref:acyltransferase family protein n=1 Tax=Curtobacterium ammoniigenes TaxID=395387 RepID=UPI0008312A65|nr:acyltransferase family protein [Curtobacterium ammoniigenes]